MRLLKSLFRRNKSVWVHCGTEELQMQFLKQCEEEGFRTPRGESPSTLSPNYIYGINNGMIVGYLSCFIWCTFFNAENAPVKIDYGLYSSGAKDYICHKSPLRGVAIAGASPDIDLTKILRQSTADCTSDSGASSRADAEKK